MTNRRIRKNRFDALVPFGDLSLADDFSQTLGDCSSPFDTGPGAPCLSSDDSPFDLALSIAEGGAQIFDLPLKELSNTLPPTPEAFPSIGNYLLERLRPATVVVSSSKTIDNVAITCASTNSKQTTGGCPPKPIPSNNTAREPKIPIKAEPTISGEAFSSNLTKEATKRVMRRSPRRSTIVATASSTERAATMASIAGGSGISTRRTVSAFKVGLRGTGAIGDDVMKGTANYAGTNAGTKKAVVVKVVKKKAMSKKFNHQCPHCGRKFGENGLKYHLDNSVCLKGTDTSKMVRSKIVLFLLVPSFCWHLN